MELWTQWYWMLPVALVVAGSALLLWLFFRAPSSAAQLGHACGIFQQQIVPLRQQFFHAAASSGKPRGLRWKEIQWDDAIEWVRDKSSGQLLAFTGITIAFEAIEGGEMEGVEAVGNLRTASAVFLFNDGRWETAGRVIFNLAPAEAVQHYHQGYERLT